MPAMANIVINDGKSTPVAHTFLPRSSDAGLAIWKEAGNSPLEQWTLTFALKEPSVPGQPYRTRASVTVPHISTGVDGVKTVIQKEIGAVEITTAATATEAEAKDIRCLMGNCLLNAVLGTAFDQRAPFYGA